VSESDKSLEDWSYKGTAFKPTPEEVAMVRRWVAEQDAVLKERLEYERLLKERPPKL
jgi:hypothetical protein